jgi:hypothetical protein
MIDAISEAGRSILQVDCGMRISEIRSGFDLVPPFVGENDMVIT